MRRGGLVVCPTETLPGLTADATREEAVRRIRQLKGRDDGKPILVVIADDAGLDDVAAEVSPEARRIADAFWPGPVTIVVPARADLPAALTGGGTTVGVRRTSHETLAAIVRLAGVPVTSTSVNRAGEPPAASIDEARAIFGDDVDGYVAGAASTGAASTVVEIEDGRIRVHREGAIPAAEIVAKTGLETIPRAADTAGG